MLLLAAGCANGTTSGDGAASGGGGNTDGGAGGSAVSGAAELAFQCGNAQVCAVSTDGRSAEQLGQAQTVSPDGRWLFSAGSGCSYCDRGSLTVAAAGAKVPARTIWRFVGQVEGGPLASPDNRRVALVTSPSDVPGGPSGPPTPAGLWVLDIDGSHPQRVSSRATSTLAWDPTGRRIAFIAGANGGGAGAGATMNLEVVPASGGDARVLATVPAAPTGWVSLSWSPDGRTILLADANVRGLRDTDPGSSELLAIPAAGGPVRQIFVAPSKAGIFFGSAFYSPDGSQVAFDVGCQSSSIPGGGSGGTVIADAGFTRFHVLGSAVLTDSPCQLAASTPPPVPISLTGLIGWVNAVPGTAVSVTTVAPPTTTRGTTGIVCSAVTSNPGPYTLEGCTGDTGGQSYPLNLNGPAPWTIRWYSGRTTVLGAEPPAETQAVPTTAPPDPAACPNETPVSFRVVSGYVNGGPLPGTLKATVCVSASPVKLKPGTRLTID